MGTQTYSRSYYNDAPIDGASTGTSTVETTITETGYDRKFQCMIAQATVVESEHVAIGPVISIGTNDPYYNDMVSAKSIGGLVGEIAKISLESEIPELAEGVEIKCKVNTAAIPTLGHGATFTFSVTLHGVDRLYSE